MTVPDATTRFSNRVENYVKYRPGYPPELIMTLQADCQLTPASLVADIGSGTGILSELFLRHGNTVYAVEPNAAMRAAGERLLSHYPGFRTVVGRAEATTLPDQSVDFVVAGQAFHWFDRLATRTEFGRIVKPGGWLMLVWNSRAVAATPFMQAYEQLLQRYGTDYAQIDHTQITATDLVQFLGQDRLRTKRFTYVQQFDQTGIAGRLLSSSYAPEAGHPDYEPMLAELMRLFQRHQQNGVISFVYDTEMYYGRLLP
jgi:ubiquinone/menaquinone biosynthesis C-methylase UbiE